MKQEWRKLQYVLYRYVIVWHLPCRPSIEILVSRSNWEQNEQKIVSVSVFILVVVRSSVLLLASRGH